MKTSGIDTGTGENLKFSSIGVAREGKAGIPGDIIKAKREARDRQKAPIKTGRR
jgi:hypothetical protein